MKEFECCNYSLGLKPRLTHDKESGLGKCFNWIQIHFHKCGKVNPKQPKWIPFWELESHECFEYMGQGFI